MRTRGQAGTPMRSQYVEARQPPQLSRHCVERVLGEASSHRNRAGAATACGDGQEEGSPSVSTIQTEATAQTLKSLREGCTAHPRECKLGHSALTKLLGS